MNVQFDFATVRTGRVLRGCGALALAAAAAAACSDPTRFDSAAVSVQGQSSATPGATPGAGAGQDAGALAEVTAITQNVFNTEVEDCPADSTWLPADGGPPPPVRMFTPAPHPDTECPFYRGAYQNFLIATTPLPNGDPALVEYPTIDDAFKSAVMPPHLQRNTGDPSADPLQDPAVLSGPYTGRAWLGTVRQAGFRDVLVDQDDHTLYYGLHMNQAFYDFIQQNGLDTAAGIANVVENNPELAFPPGLVEFKTAWKDIDPHDFPDANGNLDTPNGIVPPPPMGDYADAGPPATWDTNYITTMAWVPYLSQDASGVIHEDANHPLLRRVALVAIHCVYTLPGHPEFVWGSIQHVNPYAIDPAVLAFDGQMIYGAPDTQPNGLDPVTLLPNKPSLSNPQNAGISVPASQNQYLLYAAGTAQDQANSAVLAAQLAFDAGAQSFPGMGKAESIYRMFPGSKSNVLSPDNAVLSLNSNLTNLFDQAFATGADTPQDKRFYYRLVAAVWMDKPALFNLGPDGTGTTFQNDATNPLVAGVTAPDGGVLPPDQQNLYPNVSQGTFCGTPLTSPPVSGDSPDVVLADGGVTNTVPGCSTRADDMTVGYAPAWPSQSTLASDGNPVPPAIATNPLALYTTQVMGTDYEFSLLGGEDRLSSTAMESFTQNQQFQNCFTCHNTKPVDNQGVPLTPGDPNPAVIPYPALINVSHLFSEFLLREQSEGVPLPFDGGAPAAGAP